MRRLDRAFALVGGGVILVYAIVPHSGVIDWLSYDGIGAACVVAMVVGIVRNRPSRPAPWVWCAVGLALFVGGDFVWSYYEQVLHRSAPVASLADALYLPAYLVLAAGCMGLIRSRGGRDPDAFLDALVAALGGAVIAWSLIILPASGSAVPMVDRIVVSLYPLMDLAILAVLIRLLLVPGRRSAVLWLIVGSFAILLVGDAIYAFLQQTDSYTPGVIDATWLFGYLALGVAALHPQMGTFSEHDPRSEPAQLGWGRTLMLGVALLVGPIASLSKELAEPHLGTSPVAVLTAIISGLVLWRIVRATRQRQRAEATLIHSALHDPVTGLPNRRLLLDRVQQAIARLPRGSTGVAVFFLDLDRFKEVNDGLGHAAGDRLLVAVGQRLTGVVRPVDTVARLGGDEFVVCCEGISSNDDAMGTAVRIMEVLARPFDIPDGEVFVTASMGVSIERGRGGTAEELIHHADVAMYRAKDAGRNRFGFFDETMRSEATSRLETVNELHRALLRDELCLVYQPIVHLQTGAIVAVEALIRWNHPERGLIAPDRFIPLAEASGLIVPVGWWVAEEALGQAQRWNGGDGPLAGVAMGVNVSAIQLREPDFASRFQRIIRDKRLDPDLVWMELTESTLIENAESSFDTVAAIRSASIHVSLDDFGTGYSSLSYLQRYPVDSLKIDRSFVSGLGSDPGDTVIVGAILAMANALGLDTIAEGVETAEQLERLHEMGCALAQGYYFARPMSAEDLEAAVAGWTKLDRQERELLLSR